MRKGQRFARAFKRTVHKKNRPFCVHGIVLKEIIKIGITTRKRLTGG